MQLDKIETVDQAVAYLTTPGTNLKAQLQAAREARETTESAAAPWPAASASRFRVLTDAESDALPPPTWLVDGIILQSAVNIIYGPGGVGKSFITIDLACSLAAGRPDWYGKETRPGAVIYIAAEAPEEVAQRKRAWKDAFNQPEIPNFYLVPDRVPLLDPTAVPDLLASLPPEAQRPALIVIDTLSRTMRGGDENSTKDMGLIFEAAELLRDHTGAAILIIHHTGKNVANGARGASSLIFDARQALAVSQDDGIITLVAEKHNNSSEQAPLRFVLRPALDTRVLAPAAPGSYSDGGPLNARQWQILDAIASPSFIDGARNKDIADHTGLANTQISRNRDNLITRGYVRAEGEPKHPDRRYFLTEAGQAALAQRDGSYSSNTSNTTVTTSNSNSTPQSNGVTGVTHTYRVCDSVTVTGAVTGDIPAAEQGKSLAQPKAPAQPQTRVATVPCEHCHDQAEMTTRPGKTGYWRPCWDDDGKCTRAAATEGGAI